MWKFPCSWNYQTWKSDNDDAVTGASKQSKSSSIDDVEIVDDSTASKDVRTRVKPKAAVAAKMNVKRQFQDSWLSDFARLLYENGQLTFFLKKFPGMAGNSDFLKREKYWNFNIKTDLQKRPLNLKIRVNDFIT